MVTENLLTETDMKSVANRRSLVAYRRPVQLTEIDRWGRFDSIRLPFKAGTDRDAVERLAHQLADEARDAGEMLILTEPFTNHVLFATDEAQRLLVRDGLITGSVSRDTNLFAIERILAIYRHTARVLFGWDLPGETASVVAVVMDPETGLDRHLRLFFDLRLLEPRRLGNDGPPPFEEFEYMVEAPSDVEAWFRLLPPEELVFHGVETIRVEDVTEDEALSQLKTDLLESESVGDAALYPLVLDRIRTYLRQPHLHFGLAYLDGSQILPVYHRNGMFDDCLFGKRLDLSRDEVDDSIFDRAFRDRSVEVVHDLTDGTDLSPIEREVADNGAISLAVAPLFERDKRVGVFYLWSTTPGQFRTLDAVRLHTLLPLFVAVVRRFTEEMRARIQAVILGEYTAIHPSVEWRFRKAALNYVRRQDQGRRPELEPIVFDNVYPLFAAADIRGSSTHRSEAVQFDLLDHLAEVRSVLELARKIKPLPIIEYLLARTDQYRESLASGLTSDDEATVRDFLHRHIQPLLDHVRTIDTTLADRIERYERAANVHTGHLYQRCRSFDDSVTLLNRMIAGYLDHEEQRAQSMFPHYFEKHETDGIEFSIFVGESLVEEGTFDPIYVRNLRLWQLMVMCGIGRRAAQIKKRLDIPLEITNLILAQSTPISIRFQMDEMRFDVDGTYDIRYEIMKRRVEKALIKGGEERLTQPGKVAVVYSQAREAWEYEEYFRFLAQQGIIAGEPEDVELEDLQGIKGLKALRADINVEQELDEIAPEVIERAIETINRIAN